MAYDAFIKIDGVPGESTDKQHPGEIQVESFNFGDTNATSRAIGSGAAAGRVSFQDLHITAKVSKASPLLMLFCAQGKHIPNAVLTARHITGEGTGVDFLFVKMNDVLVSSVQDTFTGGEQPVDAVSFNFARVSVEYREEKVNGSIGATVAFAWDLRANKKV